MTEATSSFWIPTLSFSLVKDPLIIFQSSLQLDVVKLLSQVDEM